MKRLQDIKEKTYRILVEPRSSHEDTRRREFIVNLIILGSITLASFLFVSASINSIDLGTKYEGIPLPFLALVIAAFVGMHILSRKGHVTFASYLVISAYLAGAVFETIEWGPELPESTLPYTLAIIMTCVLLGSRWGFIATSGIGITLITSATLAQKGLAHPDLMWKTEATDISDSVEQAAIYLIIMLVSWLSAREIARSLSRARNSEEALRRERDSLEDTLERRTRELHSAQALKIADIYKFVEFGKLASGIFHDLMTPLTSVTLSIEELHENNRQLEDERISKAVFASKSIHSYMKALRRQMSAQDEKDMFSPVGVCKEAILLLEHKARKEKTSLHLSESSGLLHFRLFGNSLKFQQALINIISNSLDACKSVVKGEVQIHLWEENNALKLSVSDSGCGMSEEESRHIFEPFYTTKPENEGSGLGLSITKTIIEHDFKGTISVTSTKGKGTVFNISLPALSKSPAHLP